MRGCDRGLFRDGTSNHPDIVLKRRKWRRGTSPRALDILLEIEECIKKKKKPLSVDKPDKSAVMKSETRARIEG